jgi:hypothetical protein
MEFLNDIKVYDGVLDQRAIKEIFQYLSKNFYTLARTNDSDTLEHSKKFLRVERTPEELEQYK